SLKDHFLARPVDGDNVDPCDPSPITFDGFEGCHHSVRDPFPVRRPCRRFTTNRNNNSRHSGSVCTTDVQTELRLDAALTPGTNGVSCPTHKVLSTRTLPGPVWFPVEGRPFRNARRIRNRAAENRLDIRSVRPHAIEKVVPTPMGQKCNPVRFALSFRP